MPSDEGDAVEQQRACMICGTPMNDEGGDRHDECHEGAEEEFEWYP